MANKRLEIEAVVKTDGIDKAVSKLGELKDLGKGLKIQYDIDGKPLDVVIDKSLNLRKQVGELTKALRSVKEGSDEFRVLSTALGDANDKLAASNAKSRDLLGSLQLIPGPIGQIASQLNGALSALKLFSGFSVKDIAFQFKELGNDLSDVYKNIFGLNDAIKDNTTDLDSNTEAKDDNTGATDEATAATNAGTAANQKQTQAIVGLNNVEKNYLALNKEKIDGLKNSIRIAEQQIASGKEYIYSLNQEVKSGYVAQEQVKNLVSEKSRYVIQLQRVTEENKKSLALLETERDALLQKVTTQNMVSAATKEGQTIANSATKTTEQNTAAVNTNTGANNTNTGAKEVNTTVTAAYTAGTNIATFATNAFNIALKALGIGVVIGAVIGLVTLLGKLGGQLIDTTKEFIYGKEQLQQYKDATSKNIEASETARNKILEVGVAFEEAAKGAITKKKALEIYNEILGGTIGEAKTLEEAEKLYKDNTAGYIKSVGLRAEAQELFALAAKQSALASQVELQGYFEWFFDFDRKLGESAVDKFIRVKGNLLKEGEDFRNRAKKLLAEALESQKNFKPKDEKKPDTPDVKKIENDNKAANALLLKLQQENSVQSLNIERKKQDAQLKIDKENEEREIKNLKLSKDKEELRGKLLEQIRIKYAIKIIDLNKKRQEEDNKIFDDDRKKLKDYQDNIFEIMNSADENEFSRNRAARTKKFEDDKSALQKDTNFQKEKLEEKIRILLALEKAYKADIKKLDDDEILSKEETNQKLRDKDIKKLDDELKLLDIKNRALIEGTKSYFNNQRAILLAANKKELADLEDRAIKEKLTAQEIKDAKEAINKAYLASLKDIKNQELQVLTEQVQASLGVIQTALGDVAKVAALGQQVALEEATARYIAQNELDKKNITNQEQQEAKLLENKKKFAKEEDEIKRKAFEENKKIQIAQAIIATLQSAVGAFSSLAAIPVIGPALGAVAAASALIFGYKQVDLIRKTKYQSPVALSESETASATTKTNPGRNYAKGGMIGGKRHAQGGTMIEAEQGEAIMTRGSVAMFAPLLSMMNQAGGGVSFNSNLMTTRQDNPILSNAAQEQAPLIVKTYVVSQELTTEAQRQARLKNLSTI